MYENSTSQILGTSIGTGTALTVLGVPVIFTLLLAFLVFVLISIFYLAYRVRNRDRLST